MTDRPPCRHRTEATQTLVTLFGDPVPVHWCVELERRCCDTGLIDGDTEIQSCNLCLGWEPVKAAKRDPVEAED